MYINTYYIKSLRHFAKRTEWWRCGCQYDVDQNKGVGDRCNTVGDRRTEREEMKLA